MCPNCLLCPLPPPPACPQVQVELLQGQLEASLTETAAMRADRQRQADELQVGGCMAWWPNQCHLTTPCWADSTWLCNQYPASCTDTQYAVMCRSCTAAWRQSWLR